MPVPRLLLIFSPLTVMKPCTLTCAGVLRPLNCSIAGQNRVWKYTMSLPMKCTCSTCGSVMNWSKLCAVREASCQCCAAWPLSKWFFRLAR